MRPIRRRTLLALALLPGLALAQSGQASMPGASPAPACRGHVYLTLDTGNMSQAELIAETLARHGVKATFFLANERTPRGDHALDDTWAGYWRARVAEGHAFGSHTFDHVYLRAAPAGDDRAFILARPQFGLQAGRVQRWDGAALCNELGRVDARLRALTGRGLDPFWRAPGGRAPAAAMQAAQACGYRHVHWASAGFLGDELPSETHPNAQLLRQALAGIRAGDILIAHLGIWSRRDPWAPMLDPLITGLKARGLCFATLRELPA
jgi:peptidoglycan/xylan/chitin deacetylase (PgdA/CDA1 family)